MNGREIAEEEGGGVISRSDNVASASASVSRSLQPASTPHTWRRRKRRKKAAAAIGHGGGKVGREGPPPMTFLLLLCG